MQASGSFRVKLAPQPPEAETGGEALGRLWIDKQFDGDLEAVSRGQMLAAQGTVKGSAGYVALERVDGALAGRKGTFVLQHSGTMDRGTPSLTVTVVPDSGTGELTGLTGRMDILVEGGQHSYTFRYALPAES
jgi:hypothetical protein